MRLGVSTTGHSLKILRKLKEWRIPDFFELGICSSDRAERIIAELRGEIATIHGLPFLGRGEEDLMFNPCADPASAAEVTNQMAEGAVKRGLNYEVYGVHAGLLGDLLTVGVFKVLNRISYEEGLKNVKTFKRFLKADRIILENIYGWDEDSPAMGMTPTELADISSVMPLLLDLGHAAVNMEHYRRLSVDELNPENLDIREIHISFVKFDGPPPWDHQEYVKTPVNDRILSKLVELTASKPDLPVVIEIKGGLETIRRNLELIRSRIERS